MRETTISVTEAARNFADCISRAHYQGQSFVLLKNGVPFARIIPAGDAVCYGRDLMEALDSVELPEREAQSWGSDRKAARQKLKTPRNKWQ